MQRPSLNYHKNDSSLEIISSTHTKLLLVGIVIEYVLVLISSALRPIVPNIIIASVLLLATILIYSQQSRLLKKIELVLGGLIFGPHVLIMIEMIVSDDAKNEHELIFVKGFCLGIYQTILITAFKNTRSTVIISIFSCLITIATFLRSEPIAALVIIYINALVIVFQYYNKSNSESSPTQSQSDSPHHSPTQAAELVPPEEFQKYKSLLERSFSVPYAVTSFDCQKLIFKNHAYKLEKFPEFENSHDDTNDDVKGFFEDFTVSLVKKQTESIAYDHSMTDLDEKKLINVIRKLNEQSEQKWNSEYSADLTQETTIQAKRNHAERTQYEIKVSLINIDGNKCYSFLFFDLTKQEQSLRQKITQQNKDKIMSSLTHEIRTPINAILGIVTIIEQDNLTEENQQNCKYIKSNTQILLNTLDSIIDIQQIGQKQLFPQPTRFKVRDILQEVKQTFEYMCKKREIQLNVQVDPKVTLMFNDKKKIIQALMHLVQNAVKFTFKGEITISAQKTPGLAKKDTVEFSVIDTGVGIKDSEKENLFNQLAFSKDSKCSVGTQGIGLGLNYVRNISLLLNNDQQVAKVIVQSKENQGSTFTMRAAKTLTTKRASSGMFFAEEQEAATDDNKIKPKTPKIHKTLTSRSLSQSEYLNNIGGDSLIQLTEAHHGEQQSIGRLDPRKESMISTKEPQPNPRRDSTSLSSPSKPLLEQINNGRKSLFGMLGENPNDIKVNIREFDEENNNNNHNKYQEHQSSQKNFNGHQEEVLQIDKVVGDEDKNQKRVLVVDDNPFNLLVVTQFLKEKGGFEVLTANSGQEAIDIAKECARKSEDIARILMDIQMPVMDGFETTKELIKLMEQDEIQTVKIWALSSNDSDDVIKQCFEVGMSGHLAKPLTEEKIERLMKIIS